MNKEKCLKCIWANKTKIDDKNYHIFCGFPTCIKENKNKKQNKEEHYDK